MADYPAQPSSCMTLRQAPDVKELLKLCSHRLSTAVFQFLIVSFFDFELANTKFKFAGLNVCLVICLCDLPAGLQWDS